jgi:putrescine:ornithine antiporter
MGVVQSVMALSTMSPNLSEQFAALVNLAVVTNVIPYIVALSALAVIMRGAGVTGAVYTRNLTVAVVAIIYSIYVLWASGMEAVMGGMLVMGLGWLIWTFMAPRFALPQTAYATA